MFLFATSNKIVVLVHAGDTLTASLHAPELEKVQHDVEIMTLFSHNLFLKCSTGHAGEKSDTINVLSIFDQM